MWRLGGEGGRELAKHQQLESGLMDSTSCHILKYESEDLELCNVTRLFSMCFEGSLAKEHA